MKHLPIVIVTEQANRAKFQGNLIDIVRKDPVHADTELGRRTVAKAAVRSHLRPKIESSVTPLDQAVDLLQRQQVHLHLGVPYRRTVVLPTMPLMQTADRSNYAMFLLEPIREENYLLQHEKDRAIYEIA